MRDQLGHDPLSGHLFLFTNQDADAIESAGMGRQRIVGVRETSGEGTLPLAGSGRQAQRHDAIGGVGDAGERSGCEANPAAQLVSQERVKMLSHICRNSRKIELPLWPLPIRRCALRCWNASAAMGAADDPEEGRRDSAAPGAAAQAAHRVSGAVERNAERSATGVAGRTRAIRHARGSGSGVATRADSGGAAARTEAASGPQASAGESAAHRRSDRLRCQLHALRRRNARDRLRLERSAGPRAGQVVRARHQTRKTFVRKMFRECRCRRSRRASWKKGWPATAW